MSAEFWRLPRLLQVTGLSRSEIYRRINEGTFPRSHPYRHAPKIRFWISTEVQRWQAEQVGIDEWIALTAARLPVDEYDALLG